VRAPFFIAGNSIGGFTAMSVAADIGPLCKGLVLVNTAGRVVSLCIYGCVCMCMAACVYSE
jgi:pimeloyl-ACP methyl ester carboxylesterase